MQHAPDSPIGPWGPRQGSALPLVPQIPQVPASIAPVFTGTRRAYAAMMLRGLLLYIPTFGFNRFWLKTEQRRFFWLNTTLGGDSFEYRGTSRELVVGFLFAVAIYMPIAAAYSLAGLYAESYQSYASFPFAIFTVAFTHFAAFRARRYRLTRTTFRGLRFWMTGSGWKMGLYAFLWLILAVITLGIAWFWMQAWLERYKMRHSSYGTITGRFEGSGWSLMKAYGLPGFLISLIAFSFFGWAIYTLVTVFYFGEYLAGSGFWIFGPMFLALFVPSAWSVLSVVRTRWWLSGVRFGGLGLSNDIRSTAMLGSAMKTTLLSVMALALWGAAAFVTLGTLARWRGIASAQAAFADVGVVVALLLAVTVGLVIVMFVKAVIYNFDFMQRIVATTTVSGLHTIAGATAAGEAQGLVGEGLADALGADGF